MIIKLIKFLEEEVENKGAWDLEENYEEAMNDIANDFCPKSFVISREGYDFDTMKECRKELLTTIGVNGKIKRDKKSEQLKIRGVIVENISNLDDIVDCICQIQNAI